MKFLFPDYVNNKPDWRGNACERGADENDHYKSIDDIKKYIDLCFEPRLSIKTDNDIIITNNQKIKIINSLQEEITKAITNNKICRFIANEFEDRKKNIEYILIQYPVDVKDKWKQQTEKLVEIERENMRKSNTFVKQNKEEIFKLFLHIKEETKLLIKEKKKASNKKYYENVRALLDIKPREILTDEQKKENRELSIKKYYEKYRLLHDITPREILTDEQKKENRKLSQKKYQEKQLLLNNKEPRVKLTEEEKKEKKKLANQKYREKQKENIVA